MSEERKPAFWRVKRGKYGYLEWDNSKKSYLYSVIGKGDKIGTLDQAARLAAKHGGRVIAVRISRKTRAMRTETQDDSKWFFLVRSSEDPKMFWSKRGKWAEFKLARRIYSLWTAVCLSEKVNGHVLRVSPSYDIEKEKSPRPAEAEGGSKA